MSDPSRGAFGDFLRSRREKLTPRAAGLPSGRRRTPGLRREEVAERAGIGVDWYVRLEQGRAVKPSAATVEALGRALELSKTEQAHLRALADNPGRPRFVRESVPDALRELVVGLAQPAYVTGRRWDVLAWNAAAADVFTDFAQIPEESRNILAYVLTDPQARRLFGTTWAAEARRMVAQFRISHDLWAGDPSFATLLETLRLGCPEFAGWWEAHDIRAVAGGRKALDHPVRGRLHFDHASFQSNDAPALKLVIYTPVGPGDPDAPRP